MARINETCLLLLRLLMLYGGVAAILVLAFIVTARAGDPTGKYANSPLKPWFDQLRSRKGLCCSYTDGFPLMDEDWDTRDGHYRVRLPDAPGSTAMIWVDVPEEALVTEPNRYGRTMVWPVYTIGADPPVWIRCFMPGPMT